MAETRHEFRRHKVFTLSCSVRIWSNYFHITMRRLFRGFVAMAVVLVAISAPHVLGQQRSGQQLSINQKHFRVRPGEFARIPTSLDDVEFVRSARVRLATAA